MNKNILLFIVLIFFTGNLNAGKYSIDTTKFEKNGWEKPLFGNLITSTNYDYDSEIYLANHGFHHAAYDIVAEINDSVYSIDDGIIVDYRRYTSNTLNESVVIIKHITASNIVFYTIYGHTYLKPGLKKGDNVKKGDVIGVIKEYASPIHLHFTINTQSGSISHWGRINDGSVDPINFLNTKSNGYSGTFDGAGSLVNPLDQGAGRNYDIVKLHPHNDSGSVGVFQWKYDNNFCSKIELFSSSSLGDVLIQVKGWSDHTFKQSFKVNLKAKEKVTIESDSYWTTLALTTLEPLDHRTDLIARCATDNDEFYNANREEVEANLVDVTNDYYWTGTGSLITDSDNLEDGGFGYMLDLATTYSSMKGLTSFQWKATDRCSNITISKASLTEKVAVNGIILPQIIKTTF